MATLVKNRMMKSREGPFDPLVDISAAGTRAVFELSRGDTRQTLGWFDRVRQEYAKLPKGRIHYT